MATDTPKCSNGYRSNKRYDGIKIDKAAGIDGENPISERFSKTRNQHANETAEDYVEAVAEIIERSETCRVLDLARHFAVSHVTVSRIVKRLQAEELLETSPYQPITLTAKGSKLARQVKQRHQIVLEFLVGIGVDRATAEIDSEGIEHHVSTKTLAAMKSFLNRRS